MSRRLYFPADYAGLTFDEKRELEDMQISRAEYDRLRRRIGHGDLCCALMHLRRAEAILGTADADLAGRIAPLAGQLALIVPSYLQQRGDANAGG